MVGAACGHLRAVSAVFPSPLSVHVAIVISMVTRSHVLYCTVHDTVRLRVYIVQTARYASYHVHIHGFIWSNSTERGYVYVRTYNTGQLVLGDQLDHQRNHMTTIECFDWCCKNFGCAMKTCRLAQTLPSWDETTGQRTVLSTQYRPRSH